AGAAEVLKTVRNGLTDAGWQIAAESAEEKRYFRSTSERRSQVFEAYRPSSHQQGSPGSDDWDLVYAQRMNEEANRAGLRAMLARDPTDAALVPFLRWWHLESDAVADYFTRHAAQLPPSLAFLARRLIKEQRLDEARQMLNRAVALMLIRQVEVPD